MMMRSVAGLAVLGFLAVALPMASAQFESTEVFYSTYQCCDTHFIWKMETDGTNRVQLVRMTTADGVPEASVFSDIALDPALERMYWTAGSKIYSAFMNGTDITQLRSTAGAIHYGIDLQTRVFPRTLYFTDLSTRTISRSTIVGFDDAGASQVVPTRPGHPYFLTVAPNDDLFWTERVDFPLTYVFHRTAAGVITQLSAATGSPNAIAVDVYNMPNYLYYGDSEGGPLTRLEVYGPSPTPTPAPVSSIGGSEIAVNGGVSLDTAHNLMAYVHMQTTEASGIIYTAALDGTGTAVIKTVSGSIPVAIALNGVTPTASPSPSSTASPSHTASQTSTRTPTSSIGTTSTPTSSASSSPSVTPSQTGTPTQTPSVTPTHSPTQTPSHTHSSSTSPSHSPSPTQTPSMTPSDSGATPKAMISLSLLTLALASLIVLLL